MLPRIGGCAFRDRLAAQARAGDQNALEALIASLPPTLPPAVRRRIRDGRIRALGLWLCSELPGCSSHRIAALLVAAGRRYGSSAQLDVLASDERARLVREVRDITQWAPWPGHRQTLRVLSNNRDAMTCHSAHHEPAKVRCNNVP